MLMDIAKAINTKKISSKNYLGDKCFNSFREINYRKLIFTYNLVQAWEIDVMIFF